MKTTITIFTVFAFLIFGYVIYTTTSDNSTKLTMSGLSSTTTNTATDQVTTTENPTRITHEPSVSDRQVYLNQDWRFSFEYPNDWKIADPASYSKVSMLNIAVWPESEGEFYPVRVIVTPKWWIDRILNDPTIEPKQPITVGSVPGWTFDSITMSVIPTTVYLFLMRDDTGLISVFKKSLLISWIWCSIHLFSTNLCQLWMSWR